MLSLSFFLFDSTNHVYYYYDIIKCNYNNNDICIASKLLHDITFDFFSKKLCNHKYLPINSK